MVNEQKIDAERVVADLSSRKRELTDQINATEFEWTRFTLYVLGGAVALSLYALVSQSAEGKSDWRYLVWFTLGGAAGGAWAYRTFLTNRRSSLRRDVIAIERQLGVEELRVAPQEDFFTRLVSINFRYIEQYYLQTREQADKSFGRSAAVATVGFLTVIAGIVLMYRGLTQPAYVTAASGVLTEFIGAISEGLDQLEQTRALTRLMDRLSQDVNYLLVAEDLRGLKATARAEQNSSGDT